MVDVVEVVEEGFVGVAGEERSDGVDLAVHHDQHAVALSRIDGIFLMQLLLVTLQDGLGLVALADDLAESAG